MYETPISIIIARYNKGKYIDADVDSLLNQTFQDFEVIIVYDGSTDELTIKKLSDYGKPKTTVILTEKHGIATARNTGFKETVGEFI